METLLSRMSPVYCITYADVNKSCLAGKVLLNRTEKGTAFKTENGILLSGP
jgi:hypothetical protein